MIQRDKRRDPPPGIGNRVRYILGRKFRAYANVFDTEEGRVVLRDLYELIQPITTTPIQGGDGVLHSLRLAKSDGAREVWEHIRKRLSLTGEEIERQAMKYETEEYDDE